jgi:pyruvate formate lyase activating enzyme
MEDCEKMKECVLYQKEKNEKVKCLACSHKCLIGEGKTGICGVRKDIAGKLFLLVYGKVASMNADPIEKKPLYHFLSGTKSFSIGTVGCNFKCEWCQNFDISQASRQRKIFGENISAEQVVEMAIKTGCKSIAYTYNEPAIFVEFIKDCAVLAKKRGLKNILVTNGYFSKESFYFIKEYIDAVNIDLKSFNEKAYQKYCGAKLEFVLENIKWFHEAGIHVEITTLVIPGLNDSNKELEKIARFIASINVTIPWHISRFFPRYKMKDKEITPIETLNRAEKIGKKYLKYVYMGNI